MMRESVGNNKDRGEEVRKQLGLHNLLLVYETISRYTCIKCVCMHRHGLQCIYLTFSPPITDLHHFVSMHMLKVCMESRKR